MNFVSIDFETANYSRESACSVGLIKYHNGKEIDSYYSLIQPPVLFIRPDFTEIHGLTVEDVKKAPTFLEIWNDVWSFIDEEILVAHNASFDMGVLNAVLNLYNIPKPEFTYFCTLKLARRAWPELKLHKLTELAKNFGITYKAHHALADAQTCGDIVIRAAKKYKSNTVKDLLLNAGMVMCEL